MCDNYLCSRCLIAVHPRRYAPPPPAGERAARDGLAQRAKDVTKAQGAQRSIPRWRGWTMSNIQTAKHFPRWRGWRAAPGVDPELTHRLLSFCTVLVSALRAINQNRPTSPADHPDLHHSRDSRSYIAPIDRLVDTLFSPYTGYSLKSISSTNSFFDLPSRMPSLTWRNISLR